MSTNKHREHLEKLKKEGLQVNIEQQKTAPYRDPMRDKIVEEKRKKLYTSKRTYFHK